MIPLMLAWRTCIIFENTDFENNCFQNISWKMSHRFTTTFVMYLRSADVAYFLNNGSIISIGDLSDPSPQSISPSDIFIVLNQAFAYATEPLPALNLTDLITYYTLFDYDEQNFGGLYLLRSILALVLVSFNVNSFWNSINANVFQITPADLHVTGTYATSVNRVMIDKWTVIIFVLLGVGIFAWCITWLIWTQSIQGPRIGPFPLLDFASKIASAGSMEDSSVELIGSVAVAEQSEVREQLENVRLYFGEIGQQNLPEQPVSGVDAVNEKHSKKAGILLRSSSVQPLTKGSTYI
jgi:hypothetical protein